MIIYNGVRGGLGRYFCAATPAGSSCVSLQSRLEDHVGFRAELQTILSAAKRRERVTLVHMAAKVSVAACEVDPAGAYKTNVEDAYALINEFSSWASEQHLQYNVVYVSSGHVYAVSDERLTEESPTSPRSTYARTKLAAENVLRGLAQAHLFSLTIARVFGLLGPGQRDGYLLPSLIRRMKARDMSPIPGLDNVRDYLDTRDVCRVLVKLCERQHGGIDVVNVCSGHGYLVRDLASHVFMELHPNKLVPDFERGDVGDVPIIVGDPSKLIEIMGHPQTITKVRTIKDAIEAAK